MPNRRPNKFNRIPKLTKDGKLDPSEFQPHAFMPLWSLALSVLFLSFVIGFYARNPPIAQESLPLERVLAKEHQYLSDPEGIIIGRKLGGNQNRFDVGVVLGARLNETDFQPSLRLQSRVRHAVDGFCYGEVEHLIFSGASGKKVVGDGRRRPSEAAAMFEFALATVERAPKMREGMRKSIAVRLNANGLARRKEMKTGTRITSVKIKTGISSRGCWKRRVSRRRKTQS